MIPLLLHGLHERRGGQFAGDHDQEMVAHYGDVAREHHALRHAAGLVDLSHRGRLCLLGPDRQRFLNGQVTNNVAQLTAGQGCLAALTNAKGKLLADLNIYALPDELFLDFACGYSPAIIERLEKYVIADDVQVVDVAPLYGHLSVQGPLAEACLRQTEFGGHIPQSPRTFRTYALAPGEELYLMRQGRLGSDGFDFYAPKAALERVWESLESALAAVAGRLCGLDAWEIARIEAGLPRLGHDMDETNLPPETGLEKEALSYSKGCYIGQEVIARLRTYGQVSKALRGLKLSSAGSTLPKRGARLFRAGKDVGYITSATHSLALGSMIALGYVRRECNDIGTDLVVSGFEPEIRATIVALPFQKEASVDG